MTGSEFLSPLAQFTLDEINERWFSTWPILQREFIGNPVWEWLLALIAILIFALILRIIKGFITYRLTKIADKTTNTWDDTFLQAMKRTKWWFQLGLAIYLGLLIVELPEKARGILESIAIIILLLQVGLWGSLIITEGLSRYVRRNVQEDAATVTTVTALAFVGKLVLYSLIFLLILDNLGIDVTAMVAGLGVGGIAVALAAQNILGDLFASMSIVLDKPFVLGDFIIVGDMMGTVEKIGIKTTRIRSLSGEQLVFSNTDLLNSRIRNYKRMQERRIVFKFGITYQTPIEQMKEIPPLIRNIIDSQPKARVDRVHFSSFGDSSLDFEMVYYMTIPDYNAYMDTQQAINLAIMEAFEKRGIEFAYPTRTIFLEKSEWDEQEPASEKQEDQI